jgi:hypothetical protein
MGGERRALSHWRFVVGCRARRRSFVAALLWMTAKNGLAVGLQGWEKRIVGQ